MLGSFVRSLTRKATHLIAGVVYAGIEGFAFLLSPYGLSTVIGSEIIAFSIQSPARARNVAVSSTLLVIAARALHVAYLSIRCSKKQPSVDNDVLESIWDWNPPGDDALSSNTWTILKELVLTMRSLRDAYPEVEEYLSRPEFAAMEMAPRLYYYFKKEEKLNRAPLAAKEMQEASKEDVAALQQYRDFACFAYDYTNDDALSKALEDKGYSLIGAKYKPELMPSGSPAFFLAANNADRELMLCIRGTFSAEDVFTDLFANGASFGEEGTAHTGMLRASEYCAKRFSTLFQNFVSDSAHNSIVLLGHSLGAGVAALLCLKLMDQGIDSSRLRCYAYEPPACMAENLAKKLSSVTLSLVHNDDIVPRLAVTPFLNLLKDLSDFDWRLETKDDENMPVLLRMFTSLVQAPDDNTAPEDVQKPVQKQQNVSDYDPVVPGRVVYLSPGGNPLVIDGTSPILRNTRLSSSMVMDHFIDTETFTNALFSKP
ncbi:hypothetical protein M9435_004310 [Picochlorum sp. BPE23]|nr:hypothetical protein M9435_004310 [Picochlorum sp. BPE23]